MANKRKAFTNALSFGLGAAPTANPPLIIGSALLGGGLGLIEPELTYDEQPLLNTLESFKTGVRSSARRSATEAGSQTSTQLHAQGLGQSPLGAGITAGQRRLELQRGEDTINMADAAVKGDIAVAKEQVRQAKDSQFRSDLNAVAGAGIALVDNVATENSPLRKAIGLEDIPDPGAELLQAYRDQIAAGNAVDAGVSLEVINGKTPIATHHFAPILASLGRDIPSVHLNAYLNQKGIKASSKYGRAYRSSFRSMKQLEDALGTDFLDYVFN